MIYVMFIILSLKCEARKIPSLIMLFNAKMTQGKEWYYQLLSLSEDGHLFPLDFDNYLSIMLITKQTTIIHALLESFLPTDREVIEGIDIV